MGPRDEGRLPTGVMGPSVVQGVEHSPADRRPESGTGGMVAGTNADRPRRSCACRHGVPPDGRRRQAGSPRPGPTTASASQGLDRSAPSTSGIRLSCPTFTELTAEHELLATGALAELLVPLFVTGPNVAAVMDT